MGLAGLLSLTMLSACMSGMSQPEDNSEVSDLSYDPSVARPIEPDSMVGHALQMESALEQADFMMSDKKNYKDAVVATYTPKVREIPGHVDGIKAAPKSTVIASNLGDGAGQSSIVGENVSSILPTRIRSATTNASAVQPSIKQAALHTASGLLRPGQ